jgi:hypothetical protein
MDDSAHSRRSEWDELEARSLISVTKNGAHDTLKTQKSGSSYLKKQIHVVLLLALCAFVTIFKEDILSLILLEREEEGDAMGKVTIEDLRTLALEGKRGFDELNKKDYGEHAEQLFDTVAVMKYFKTPFDDPKFGHTYDKSKERLKRRMKIKIIESQIERGQTTFTWTIGGHSAAAGHGNLFRQASAAVIEKSLEGVFDSLGILFRTKNYAMGGTSSGPEVSMCMESIFGQDMDIISWDYGMTDARQPHLYGLWTERAALVPSRPIQFAFGQKGINYQNALVNAGGASFSSNLDNSRNILPSSDDPDVDASKLPPGLQNYLCNGHVEVGEPCKDHKWDTKHTCPNIKHQVSWHNGWKDHMFIGRMAAAFILEHLLEALDDLSKVVESDVDDNADKTENIAAAEGVIPTTQPTLSSSYLAELRAYEEKDKAAYFASTGPEKVSNVLNGPSNFNFTYFEKSRSFCRTALLPSQTRYDGVFKNTSEPSEYILAGKTNYTEDGYDMRQLPAPNKDDNNTELILVYNHMSSRSVCEDGEIDSKDIFYLRDQDGWMKTSIPNEKEATYFGGNYDFKGIIMLCTLVFDWERYPPDYVRIPDFFNETLATKGGILVNGVKATNSTGVGKNCHLLRHDESEKGYFFPLSEEGQKFDLQLGAPRDGGNVYLTSLIAL